MGIFSLLLACALIGGNGVCFVSLPCSAHLFALDKRCWLLLCLLAQSSIS